MENLLLFTARIAALIGVGLCAAALAVSMTGTYLLAGFEVGTVLQGGIAAMVLGCLAYSARLAEYPRR